MYIIYTILHSNCEEYDVFLQILSCGVSTEPKLCFGETKGTESGGSTGSNPQTIVQTVLRLGSKRTTFPSMDLELVLYMGFSNVA